MGQNDDERRTRGSDAALKRYQTALAWGLMGIDVYREAIQEGRPTLTGIAIKCDPNDEEGVLIVLKGYQGSDWLVAFHRDISVCDAIRGAGERLRNGSLKWKPDVYAT